MTARLRRALLDWYGSEARPLPWRRTREPYAVWISEVMLQQTTVETVLAYYDRFLGRYPDLLSLARSNEDDLLALWSGLGYYRRARNLRAAAAKIIAERSGIFPSDPEAIRALPGIGRYTAGAIASICFGIQAPVVDTNVVRVLSRMFAIPASPPGRGHASVEATLWRIAEELVPREQPGDWNQALMELGSRICRPGTPLCKQCPARFACRAFAEGDPSRYGSAKKRTPAVDVRASVFAVSRGGRVLFVRRPKSELLGGLWELPGTLSWALAEPATTTPPPGRPSRARAAETLNAAAAGTAREALGFAPVRLERAGSVRHAVTHRRLAIEVWRGEAPRRLPVALQPEIGEKHLWIEPDRIRTVPIGSASLKALERACPAATRQAPLP